ncbi:unnamed protein product [Coregonus sp. 'balchen']|nr:unnamed protein product [Coregonus sp. 'balchen']
MLNLYILFDSILFKGSFHCYSTSAFHNHCNRQGPTILVAYKKTGFVFGGYISKDYAETGQAIHDDKAFLYSMSDQREKPLRNHYKVNAAEMYGNNLVLTECEVYRVEEETCQAIAGNADRSLTTQFRTFSIKSGKGGKPLPQVLCDTMGLGEATGEGLDMDDIVSIYKGHVQDRYQFNPMAPLQPDVSGNRKHATLNDQIHCVEDVVDASSFSDVC